MLLALFGRSASRGLTPAAFRNAAISIAAAGGSTNGILHLLALARDSPPRFEPVDLASVIEFAWAQLTKPEHTLDVTVAPDAGSVPADESQLRQVLVNLMENATQAMTEGGAVEVQVARCTLTRPGEEVDAVRIRIEDSGAGFTPEALEHLFEPLFTTKARGIGLGLPLCHRIVTKHHGRLSASNRSPRGARLDIVLPLAQKGMS